jgi:predicted TIM-barrel fold metal-dependent hydrolase
MLAIAGWGWNAEVAVHILRLSLPGAIDRHPRLKLLIGHMGRGLPTMMERTKVRPAVVIASQIYLVERPDVLARVHPLLAIVG